MSKVNKREASVMTASPVVLGSLVRRNDVSHTDRRFNWSENHSSKATSS